VPSTARSGFVVATRAGPGDDKVNGHRLGWRAAKAGGRRDARWREPSAIHPAWGDGKVNEQVTLAASGPRWGDSEVNARVNAGAHPSRREPTIRLRVA
jgi:hypothetical protein